MVLKFLKSILPLKPPSTLVVSDSTAKGTKNAKLKSIL